MTDADRNALRARELAAIPAHYSPVVHILTPSLWGLLVIGACALLIRDLRAIELLTIPLMLVASNAAEWRMHRDWLHKRDRFLPALYDRHTPIHHRIYVTDDMQVRELREMKFVLIPAWAAIALFVGLLPFAAALWFFVAHNVALLFLATAMFYVVTYELLHASYHLPKDSRVGRLAVIRALSRHHAIHHDPRLMQKWNMNVNLPLWDIVRRTRISDEKRHQLLTPATDRA
jgi:hypothetical protein